MSRIFLRSKRKSALINLQNSFFDKNGSVDGLVYLQGMISIVPDYSDPRPFEVRSLRFTGVCKLYTFKTDFIFLVGHIYDNGRVLFAKQDCICDILASLYPYSFSADLVSFQV